MITLSTVDEIDEMLAECDRAAKISDRALRDVFQKYQMAPMQGLPDDPFSSEYYDWQMSFYQRMAGRKYAETHEVTNFDVASALDSPVPFSNSDCQNVGEYLMLMGFLIRTMKLRPGSRILEYGPGWGNTTTTLAMMGYQVTAVDVEPRFCDLIRRRAARGNLDIEVIDGNFFWHETADRKFDAVVFFECFHHCADHMRLLRGLEQALEPDGAIFFGAEPINDEFPIPWGLRLDGESLWAVRGNGWMELGFSSSYFRQALARCGWIGYEDKPNDVPWSRTWTAKRPETWRQVLKATDPRIYTQIGTKTHEHIVFAGQAGVGLYGPYVPLPATTWMAIIHFDCLTAGSATMDVSIGEGTEVCGVRQIFADTEPSKAVCLAFTLARDAARVEVRLFADPGFEASVEAIELVLA